MIFFVNRKIVVLISALLLLHLRARDEEKYNPAGWGCLLEAVVTYLRGTYSKFRRWHEGNATEDDSPFDYWEEWC